MAQLVEIKKVTVGPRDLDALVEMAPDAPLMTSEDIEATARVFHLMPEIADHVCLGDAGSRFRDAMGHTELAHLLEHMTVELLARTNIAGDITCGRTYPVPGNERAFDVVFPCPDDVLVTSALSSAAWIMEWAYTGGGEPEPDVDAIVDGIVGLVQSVSGPVDNSDDDAEQGEPAEEDTQDQEQVEGAPLAEETAPAEKPAAAAAADAPATPESTLVSPSPVPAPSASAQDNELDEPDDVAAEAQSAPAEPDAHPQDQGDWDMDNMPRPRPVR
jgi:uncharacterized membrane protein